MISFFTVLSWLSQEAYPILIGDLDPSGNLQANIIHAPSGDTLEAQAFFSRIDNYSSSLHRQPADKDDGGNHGGEVAECADDSRLQGWEMQNNTSPPPPGEKTLMANFKGRDYTASLTAGNPDLLGGSGMAVCHYLQVKCLIGVQ